LAKVKYRKSSVGDDVEEIEESEFISPLGGDEVPHRQSGEETAKSNDNVVLSSLVPVLRLPVYIGEPTQRNSKGLMGCELVDFGLAGTSQQTYDKEVGDSTLREEAAAIETKNKTGHQKSCSNLS
jgi:hypothetical protein